MFNVGAGEIALILVAALLILGPKRLPEMMRVIGKFMREFRRQTDDVRGMVEREFYKMDEEIVRPLEDKPAAELAPGVEPPPVVEDPADPSLHPDHPDHYKDDNPPIHVPPEPMAKVEGSSPIPQEPVNGAAEDPAPIPQAVPTAVSRERAREQKAAESAGANSGEKKVVN